MKDKILTSTGKLQEKFLPAIYFDTSVLVDYWMTEGMEMPETGMDKLMKGNESPHLQVVRDILRSEKRINKVIDNSIRKSNLHVLIKKMEN